MDALETSNLCKVSPPTSCDISTRGQIIKDITPTASSDNGEQTAILNTSPSPRQYVQNPHLIELIVQKCIRVGMCRFHSVGAMIQYFRIDEAVRHHCGALSHEEWTLWTDSVKNKDIFMVVTSGDGAPSRDLSSMPIMDYLRWWSGGSGEGSSSSGKGTYLWQCMYGLTSQMTSPIKWTVGHVYSWGKYINEGFRERYHKDTIDPLPGSKEYKRSNAKDIDSRNINNKKDVSIDEDSSNTVVNGGNDSFSSLSSSCCFGDPATLDVIGNNSEVYNISLFPCTFPCVSKAENNVKECSSKGLISTNTHGDTDASIRHTTSNTISSPTQITPGKMVIFIPALERLCANVEAKVLHLTAFSRVFTLDSWMDFLIKDCRIRSGEPVTEHLLSIGVLTPLSLSTEIYGHTAEADTTTDKRALFMKLSDDSLEDAHILAEWKLMSERLTSQVDLWERQLEEAHLMKRHIIRADAAEKDPADRHLVMKKSITLPFPSREEVEGNIIRLTRLLEKNKLIAIECVKLKNKLSDVNRSAELTLHDVVLVTESIMEHFPGIWPSEPDD